MLRIECPWCGLRDEPEFTYGGESHITRPPAGAGERAGARAGSSVSGLVRRLRR